MATDTQRISQNLFELFGGRFSYVVGSFFESDRQNNDDCHEEHSPFRLNLFVLDVWMFFIPFNHIFCCSAVVSMTFHIDCRSVRVSYPC